MRSLANFALNFALVLAASTASADIEVVALRDPDLVGDFYVEIDRRPATAILLLGGSDGGIAWEHSRHVVRMLVERGYAVLALAYFGQPTSRTSLQSIPLETFEHAIDWLIEHPATDGGPVVLVGGSKGAEAALLLASRLEAIAAVVAFAPSVWVFQGIGARTSSWSSGRVDIPYAPFVDNETRRRALANFQAMEFIEVYRDAIRAQGDRQDAVIKVERIRAPILLASGSRDRLWPSQEMGDAIVARVRESGSKHPIEHLVLDHGHSVHGHPDAWPRVLEFLARNIKHRASVPVIR